MPPSHRPPQIDPDDPPVDRLPEAVAFHVPGVAQFLPPVEDMLLRCGVAIALHQHAGGGPDLFIREHL